MIKPMQERQATSPALFHLREALHQLDCEQGERLPPFGDERQRVLAEMQVLRAMIRRRERA